ncbi:MAG: hypothetical protein CM15mP85_17900 [Rhodobacterales bacterium]|nr:MAG: hypothetical protein CM15mP85_17900 [Rhodobacterales bacterium]
MGATPIFPVLLPPQQSFKEFYRRDDFFMAGKGMGTRGLVQQAIIGTLTRLIGLKATSTLCYLVTANSPALKTIKLLKAIFSDIPNL